MKRKQSPAPHEHKKWRVRTIVVAPEAHMVRVMGLRRWGAERVSLGVVCVRLP